jgi:hypothetical protein
VIARRTWHPTGELWILGAGIAAGIAGWVGLVVAGGWRLMLIVLAVGIWVGLVAIGALTGGGDR